MIVVDDQGLQRALQNPLPPNLFFVSGNWQTFGQDAIVLPCQGLSGFEMVQLLCLKLGVSDLLTRVALPERKLVVCVHVRLGAEGLVHLIQAPSILYGLRLVVATRYPLIIRCSSVSSRYIDVRLTDGQMIDILEQKLKAPREMISYLLDGFRTRDIDELAYIIANLKPTYERLMSEDPLTVWKALTPFINQRLECHFSIPDDKVLMQSELVVPALNRISMFILTAAFLASYNPVGSDLSVFQNEKRRKSRKGPHSESKGKVAKISQLQLGPKDFALDRMLEILKHISSSDVFSNDVYTHISNLAAMKFLAIISGNINAGRSVLDATKLRCLIDFNLASAIAQKVGLTLSHYLFDPST